MQVNTELLNERIEYYFVKTNSFPSSSFTLLKKSQLMQESYFWANVPCFSPLQKVPVTDDATITNWVNNVN